MNNPYIGAVIEQRLDRLELLQGALLGAAALPLASWSVGAAAGGLSFKVIADSQEDTVILPPGYTHDVVIHWGDSLHAQTPNLDTTGISCPSSAFIVDWCFV